jgi:hypothetical protein
MENSDSGSTLHTSEGQCHTSEGQYHTGEGQILMPGDDALSSHQLFIATRDNVHTGKGQILIAMGDNINVYGTVI